VSSPEQRWTDRLHLRPVSVDDTAAIVAIGESEQDVRDYVGQWSGDGLGYWAVEHRGRLVGVAGLRFGVFQLRDCWQLYYCFAADVRGRGYATEAALEAVAVAIDRVPRLPVVARLPPENVAARRVAEGAGLVRWRQLDADGLLAFVSHW
jgi:RimJ/RimL family protein N-acetyltransferase